MSTLADNPSPCVLFLDFDGVTHPEPCFKESVFSQLPLIEEVLREQAHQDIEIVISSSWRNEYSLDDMRCYFSHDIAFRVIGVTPSITKPGRNWLPGHAPKFERQWEIEAWLKQNRPWGMPWLALDDRDYWFAPECPHLLLTDCKTGFTAEDAVRLRALLGEVVMSNPYPLYDRCLAIFEHTLEKETRISAAINQGLRKLVNKDLIESVSAEVSSAIACGQRVWMTSDLHFGHANIISYSNRPFRGLEDMTDTHIRLLQKVGPEEIIVFVGDMALGDYQSGVDLMRLIPGRKILVAGNHDLTKDGQCKLACERGLFEAVVPFLFWQGSVGQLVLVTHYPILAPAQRGVVINYHGHLHEEVLPWAGRVKYINVGWDVSHAMICL